MAKIDILAQDIDDIISRFGEEWQKFSNKTVLVTGASGLIESLLARVFLGINKKNNANIKILLLARSEQSIKELFGDDINERVTVYYQNDIAEPLDIPCEVDYIIHTAAPANSKYYIEEPVETMDAIINGSKRMLELARAKKVKKIVLMSSMEAYGVCGDSKVKEDVQGYVNLQNARSSYAVGKRAAEFLAYAYFKEYGVPSISVRLAMCFGAG